MPEPSLLSGDRPLVLLPVRLETRFFGQELRVRVFPDRIHVDTHEPELTADEVEWGKHFHGLLWQAKTEEERKDAWRQLAERYGPQRSAWVTRQLTPTNPAERSAKPPKFSQPPVRPEAQKNETWTRAPRTSVLPDQWIATAFVSGASPVTATGKPIPDPLPVGPNPQADVSENDEALAIDDGMKWMVDFDEAERLGMAVRLPLPAAFTTAQKVDRLIVFGVKQSLDGTASAGRLKNLIESHQYTDGFGFVPPGTPTNNTDEESSGFSTDDQAYDESFRLALGSPQFEPGDGSNGDALRLALGLPAELFARTANAGARDQAAAGHMNRVLWPATWGYYLEQMMALGVVSPPDEPADLPGLFPAADIDANLDWARRHFVDYVRAGGSLPAIRAGKQPYGVLPVTALDLWGGVAEEAPDSRKDERVVAFIRRLQDYWQAESGSAPRIGDHANPDIDFKAVFGMDGLSHRFSVRNVFGLFYVQELLQLLGQPVAGIPNSNAWLRMQRSMAIGALSQLAGLGNVLPRAASTICEPFASDLDLALVQAEPQAKLTFNYIDHLLKAADVASVSSHAGVPAPFSLLYLLLRHSLLLEYAGAAARVLGRAPPQRAEPEHVRFSDLPMETPLDRISLAQLHTGPPWAQPVDAQVQEFRKTLTRLKDLDADKLSLLMRGSMDVASYRLDAWVSSFATKRLQTMRRLHPAGVYLGGYGWLEDIRPGPAPTPVTPPAGETGPVGARPNDPGFVHAPSLDHAATVAVLRSGHLTHSDPDKREVLSIDLTAKRARTAQYLLDGVRGGQSLGALLGYRFERGLHDRNLDVFIAPFRQLFPVTAVRVDEAGRAAEFVAADRVVDGLDLMRQTKDWGDRSRVLQRVAAIAERPMPPAVEEELDALVSAADAVGDALLAESAHHVVKGNPTRAAATLDALERGEAPPPDLEVIRTPRSGSAFTHRVVTLLPGTPVAVADWASTARSQAEPALNAWAARLLGSPMRIRCVVERIVTATGALVDKREVRLKDLRLAPLDVIYAQESTEELRQSELEQRILFQVRRTTNLLGSQALRLNPGRDAAWTITDVSWSEFLEVARVARSVLVEGRALAPADLDPAAGDGVLDSTYLKQRADRALNGLRQLLTNLRTALAGASVDTLETLRAAMHAMAGFGIPGAIPLSAAGRTPDDLRTLTFQARSLELEATGRLARADASSDSTERLKHAFGKGFVVLPRFRPGNANDIKVALSASTTVQDGDAMAVIAFHQRMARVREGVARLDDALQIAEALGNGDALTLQVAQLPSSPGERWVGLPDRPGVLTPAGRLSLVVHQPEPIDLALPIAGLLIDEWVEVVPSANETTGLVFQYNQPDSVAPQAILVAVHPNPALQSFWSYPWLLQLLRETLSLVHMRAVPPESLDETAHYLPATYVAMNAAGETVSTDFSRPAP